MSPLGKPGFFFHDFDDAARNILFNKITDWISFNEHPYTCPLAHLSHITPNAHLRTLSWTVVSESEIRYFKLTTYMKENGIKDEAIGLLKIFEHIDKISPQFHHGFRSDTQNIY